MREDVAGVDTSSFFELPKKFSSHVKDLTAEVRKVLLTYDADRPHMIVLIILHFRYKSHRLRASMKTRVEKLNRVTLQSSGHSNDKNEIGVDADIKDAPPIELYQLCSILRVTSFNRPEIVASFEKSGLWLVNLLKKDKAG